MTSSTADRPSPRGFSLIEVLIAMGILTTGLLSLAGFMAYGLRFMNGSSYSLIAREKAREAVESIHTARDTGRLTWQKIQNTVGANGGVFSPGAHKLTTPGADGLVNTADDVDIDAMVEKLRTPGPDGILGNTDDIITPLTNFTREIAITPLNRDGTSIVNPNLRQITVIINYTVGRETRSYTLTTYISSFS